MDIKVKYKVGDVHSCMCENCGGITDATFRKRDVPFSDGSGIVEDILVGVCNKCDEVVLFPPQENPKVKATLERIRGKQSE